ncbi:MAG: RNA methyltransferase [Microbacteriaceae bacterium]|nr:RNA methyltransferase [Microbacteriaceae bacterium]
MIENPRADRVKELAKLRKRDGRSSSGLYLLEGPQTLREALAFSKERLVEILITPGAFDRDEELSNSVRDSGIRTTLVSERVLSSLADTVTPQGCMAVCRKFDTTIASVLKPKSGKPKLVVILEQVRDPGNAGTIIRAADAAGADGVIFSGTSVDLYNSKLVRATTGSIFHLPIAAEVDLVEAISKSKDAGLRVFAADIKGKDLLDTRNSGELSQPTAWLFGNEARGLEDEALKLADQVLKVPIYGKAESMNLATAASVCVFESAFAQRNKDLMA